MCATERSVESSVCLNHTDRPAVVRCNACHKPLCEECILRVQDMNFCSQVCVDNFLKSADNMATYQAVQRARRRRKLIKRFIMLLVLGALGYGAYWYFTRNPDKFEELKNKANQAVEEGRKTIKEVKEVTK
ncbi:MAG: B-box zinc finger protein [Lentisphaeria bacterium]|nr:B-box zinc finger protein [Lentisphaeria bacterium]